MDNLIQVYDDVIDKDSCNTLIGKFETHEEQHETVYDVPVVLRSCFIFSPRSGGERTVTHRTALLGLPLDLRVQPALLGHQLIDRVAQVVFYIRTMFLA